MAFYNNFFGEVSLMGIGDRLKIEIRLPRHDCKDIIDKLEKIDGVKVDLRDKVGHYSPYYDQPITIENFVLFPLSVSMPAIKADNIMPRIKEIVKKYLLENETAIVIRKNSGSHVVIHGPMGATTETKIFDPFFNGN